MASEAKRPVKEPEHETDVDAARTATRGLVRKVLVGTLLGALVFAALSLYADLSSLRENLGAFRWSAFALALGLATGNYGLRYLRWQYYLRRIGVRVPHGESALVFLSGFVMSVTPGKLGEVFKSLLLYESRGTSIARTAPVVFAERLTDLLALVLLTAAGSLSFERGLPVAAGGAALCGFVLLASAWRPLGELLLRIAARLPLVKKIAPRLREAYESLFTMTRPAPLLFATGLATLSWGLECVALWVLLRGLPGGGLPWDASFFAYSASTIAGAVAMMPGGLGVTEAGMTGLIQALSDGAVGSAAATAATMLCRLATLWWAVVVGAGALVVLRARQKRRPG
ncbi:MAG TPA: lysylphosphatidylglycerol synthase transmembrane domain-containing protein [Sandaracinaceae bacterium LLY-WYZ-13_1]|nr:lysylphosphatidylglycerol synthase transmembrane domain-containing protein [Sandaracinaceae bacterium LLY-WYZ-13_1]